MPIGAGVLSAAAPVSQNATGCRWGRQRGEAWGMGGAAVPPFSAWVEGLCWAA